MNNDDNLDSNFILLENNFTLENFINSSNEYLRKRCSIKTSKNLEKIELQGFHTGSIAPFGYRSVKVDAESFSRTIIRRKLIIHTDESAIVKKLFNLAKKLINQDKFSYTSLALILNEMDLNRRRSTWTSKNVKSTLRDPRYYGVKIYGAKRSEINTHKEPLKIKCPAIVTQKTFDIVDRYITRKKT